MAGFVTPVRFEASAASAHLGGAHPGPGQFMHQVRNVAAAIGVAGLVFGGSAGAHDHINEFGPKAATTLMFSDGKTGNGRDLYDSFQVGSARPAAQMGSGIAPATSTPT